MNQHTARLVLGLESWVDHDHDEEVESITYNDHWHEYTYIIYILGINLCICHKCIEDVESITYNILG